MREVRVGQWVGVVGVGGRVEGPYKVRAVYSIEVEVVCVRTGRRMVVLIDDIRPAP